MIRDIEKFNQWQPAGFDGQFQWDFLSGAFGPKIMPMDCDAVVERNGRFFIFETKNSESVSIPFGQMLSLKAMVKTGYFTVMLLFGKTPETIVSYKLWHGDREQYIQPASAEMVYERCAQWYEWVNALPPPQYPDHLNAIIRDLTTENSRLRESLSVAAEKIEVLTEYADRLSRAFQLIPPKPKQAPRKPMSLDLRLFNKETIQ